LTPTFGVQRLATEVTPPPKKKTGVFRRLLFYTSAAVGTFYVGSAFVAFNSDTYYNIFTTRIPLGISFIDFAESHNWDTLSAGDILNSGKNAALYVHRLVTGQARRDDQTAADQRKNDAPESREKSRDTRSAAAERVHSVARTLRTTVEKGGEDIVQGGAKAVAIARHQSNEFAEGVEDLIRRAEAAIAGKPIPLAATTPAESDKVSSEPAPSQATDSAPVTAQKIYDVPLPIDHQPPFGFSRPQPSKAEHPRVEAHMLQPLPLVAPAISELSASEPIIAHLASTIDNLASYLNSNPSAAEKAKDVLETAKTDLTDLASRIEKVKEDERGQLEAKLDEQTREYTLKLVELEMEAQDKLDSQEDGFRKFFDQERAKFIQAYREKLNHELQTQTELINERYASNAMHCIISS
jgi:MICOS complex subunit MIC60